MYTIRQSAGLFWGKIRRSFLTNWRRKRVEKKLERRKGACTRCGACCKLLFQCPAYDDSDGNPKCLVYNDRPGVCGLFPLDEKDLRERDIVMPDRKCGFYFEDSSNGNGNGNGNGSRPLQTSMPLRWGPPKRGSEEDVGTGNGKPRWMKGVSAIVWAYFHKPKGNGNGNGNGHSNGNGNGRH